MKLYISDCIINCMHAGEGKPGISHFQLSFSGILAHVRRRGDAVLFAWNINQSILPAYATCIREAEIAHAFWCWPICKIYILLVVNLLNWGIKTNIFSYNGIWKYILKLCDYFENLQQPFGAKRYFSVTWYLQSWHMWWKLFRFADTPESCGD